MSKIDINALRYIVMEGGGARGTTYLGAVRALEQQLAKRNETEVVQGLGDRSPGIMDYLKTVIEDGDEKKVPVIEGLAGASAGAITTYALALGLNSQEVEIVLDYDFTEFISESHPGKYRMIGEKGELLIAEDHKGELGAEKGFLIKKPELFEYNVSKDFTKVNGNAFKRTKRFFIIDRGFKMIVDGVLKNVGNFISMITDLFSRKKENNFVKKLQNWLTDNPINPWRILLAAGGPFLARLLIFRMLKKSVGIKINGQAIAGLVCDRGLSSGFKVREFFYDLTLYAATRKTYFQRQLIKYCNENKIGDNLNESDLTIAFDIGKRSKSKISGNAKIVFEHLQNLTFEELYLILGIEYAAALANYTTNSPLYSSYKWTPRFRVFEAVSASMAIPPAIRPVYNASDVYFDSGELAHNIKFPRKNTPYANLSLKINGYLTRFIDNEGKFSQTDYELYKSVVVKALQQELSDTVYFDLNNLIELNTFLPLLKDVVVGNLIKSAGGGFERKFTQFKSYTVTIGEDVNKTEYSFNRDLLTFFYNAEFKGMFIDAGYFMNIPYNYFRNSENNELDGVLAIKLDRDYPAEFLDGIHKQLKSYLLREDELETWLSNEMAKTVMNNESGGMSKIYNEFNEETDTEFEKLYQFVEKSFSNYFDNQTDQFDAKLSELGIGENKKGKRRRLKKKWAKMDRTAILNVIDAWLSYYGRKNYIKPWAVSKSIIEMGLEGYSYGSKRGQIRKLSDHNHLIALYDYGVSTFDFDLEKVRPQAYLAQDFAEKKVNLFFGNTP